MITRHMKVHNKNRLPVSFCGNKQNETGIPASNKQHLNPLNNSISSTQSTSTYPSNFIINQNVINNFTLLSSLSSPANTANTVARAIKLSHSHHSLQSQNHDDEKNNNETLNQHLHNSLNA
jgi:hypothetical protein